ncbi:ArsR/SmtB family transcription factor [Desulfofustis limnaeus]|jgi:ArsR family transcriptional regulator|uniref:HTH arsR-type domain-containing protein n=1 Tax=Desulfofustis limnaeus TaxID=2740163 RepID=A0ABM7W4I0_9BACT|nr:metalloregulator ArsR/SmtB family transcription factor [Desulfofustis limnaeus]MDX9896002.1 metalloregulator ArsR/SmtB family transcription factor [Desulfofustis sp.]BDD85825.1 hypothetical protein DPPLL_01900 [Desulfofustis limnaeus]
MPAKNAAFLQRPALQDDFMVWADVLKLLAHPSRLCLIEALANGERCVGDLTEVIGHDISTVSKHLNLLREGGLVEDQKRGKQVYYRLRIPAVLHVFYCLDSICRARSQLEPKSPVAPIPR